MRLVLLTGLLALYPLLVVVFHLTSGTGAEERPRSRIRLVLSEQPAPAGQRHYLARVRIDNLADEPIAPDQVSVIVLADEIPLLFLAEEGPMLALRCRGQREIRAGQSIELEPYSLVVPQRDEPADVIVSVRLRGVRSGLTQTEQFDQPLAIAR